MNYYKSLSVSRSNGEIEFTSREGISGNKDVTNNTCSEL